MRTETSTRAARVVCRTPKFTTCEHCGRHCPKGTFLIWHDGAELHYGQTCAYKLWKMTGGELERQARMAVKHARRDAAWAVFTEAYPAESEEFTELRRREVERSGVCGIAGEAMGAYVDGQRTAAQLVSILPAARDAAAYWG